MFVNSLKSLAPKTSRPYALFKVNSWHGFSISLYNNLLRNYSFDFSDKSQNITLNKRSFVQESTYYMIPFTWSSRTETNMWEKQNNGSFWGVGWEQEVTGKKHEGTLWGDGKFH